MNEVEEKRALDARLRAKYAAAICDQFPKAYKRMSREWCIRWTMAFGLAGSEVFEQLTWAPFEIKPGDGDE